MTPDDEAFNAAAADAVSKRPETDLELVSDGHATMALGAVSAMVYQRYGDLGSRAEGLYPPDGIPQPPEWMELWVQGIEETRATALEDEERRREMHRSVGEIVSDHVPTDDERREVDAIARAHYEAFERCRPPGKVALIPFDDLPASSQTMMRATIADMLLAGAIRPGPATCSPPGRLDRDANEIDDAELERRVAGALERYPMVTRTVIAEALAALGELDVDRARGILNSILKHEADAYVLAREEGS